MGIMYYGQMFMQLTQAVQTPDTTTMKGGMPYKTKLDSSAFQQFSQTSLLVFCEITSLQDILVQFLFGFLIGNPKPTSDFVTDDHIKMCCIRARNVLLLQFAGSNACL